MTDTALQPTVTGVGDRLTALQLGVQSGQLDRRTATDGERLLRRAGRRLQLAGDHTVVALAGGTGSGKSTMFNALAGLDLSATGQRRPTTQLPHACVWGPKPATDLLHWLEVPAERRIGRSSALDAGGRTSLDGLVLIDLPDHDSIEVTHRLEVDRLVGLVDLLIWVLDPEKYADESIHEHYLTPLAAHAGVMVVVLNQTDRLDPEQEQACLAHLQRMLTEEGLSAARPLAASALTGRGVGELRDLLTAAVASRQAHARRLGADLDALGPRLHGAAYPHLDPAGLEALAGGAAARLVEVAGVAGIGRAIEERHLSVGRRRVGSPVLSRRRQPAPVAPALVPRAEVTGIASGVAEQVGLAAPWDARLQRRAVNAGEGLADGIHTLTQQAAAEPVTTPAWWSRLALLQWGLLLLAFLGVALALVGSPLWALLVVAALGVGWLCARAASNSVATSAAAHRRAVERRLHGSISGLVDTQLIHPLKAEVTSYNAAQQALHDAGGPIRLR